MAPSGTIQVTVERVHENWREHFSNHYWSSFKSPHRDFSMHTSTLGTKNWWEHLQPCSCSGVILDLISTFECIRPRSTSIPRLNFPLLNEEWLSCDSTLSKFPKKGRHLELQCSRLVLVRLHVSCYFILGATLSKAIKELSMCEKWGSKSLIISILRSGMLIQLEVQWI